MEQRQLPLASHGAAKDQRCSGAPGGITKKIAGRDIVRTVDDKIMRLQKLIHIVDIKTFSARRDLDAGVQRGGGGGGARDLRGADACRYVQDLPVQVGQFDRLVIHNGDVTDPGRGKVENHRRAKPARTDNQHPRGKKAFLTILTNGRHDGLAGIAFKIILINLGESPFTVSRGMRIAQMVVAPVIQARLARVDRLDATDRGDGGFGSTGV